MSSHYRPEVRTNSSRIEPQTAHPTSRRTRQTKRIVIQADKLQQAEIALFHDRQYGAVNAVESASGVLLKLAR